MHMAKGGSLSFNTKKGAVREALRNPIDVLNSLNSKAGNEGYHYERLYRNLYNERFYLLAYQKLQKKEGRTGTGADRKVIGGIDMERVCRLIKKMKDHSYRPNPALHMDRENQKGKRCSYSGPSFEDKLVQEVVRLILERMYEPVFSNDSHGFRPNRSCHTALQQIRDTFADITWFIEGNVCGFYGSMDHLVLINILRRRIHDEAFLYLLGKFLKAGYLEDWTFHNTYSGTPTGSMIGPILSNVYLNELDRYMEIYMKSGCHHLRYVRYADNWLCGVTGRKQEAEEIQADIRQFLSETLKLQHSEKKSLITSACHMVRFLNYEVSISKDGDPCESKRGSKGYSRSSKVRLYVPREAWQKKLVAYGALEIRYRNGQEIFQPFHRTYLISRDDHEIVQQYNAEVTGLYHYYKIADNVSVLSHFNYVMKFSLFKTFGAKYRLHIRDVRKKYGYRHFEVTYRTEQGDQSVCYYEGGFQQEKTGMTDPAVDLVPKRYHNYKSYMQEN